MNSYGLTKKIVYENEEFNLLQAALNIEDGLEGLRYNKVIIATDADGGGMSLSVYCSITFFLQFFPDLIKRNHVYILQTPLFRYVTAEDVVLLFRGGTLGCHSRCREESGDRPDSKVWERSLPMSSSHFIGKDIRLIR